MVVESYGDVAGLNVDPPTWIEGHRAAQGRAQDTAAQHREAQQAAHRAAEQQGSTQGQREARGQQRRAGAGHIHINGLLQHRGQREIS